MNAHRVLVPIEDETHGNVIADFIASHKWPEGTEFRLIHVIEPPEGIQIPPPYFEMAMDSAIASSTAILKAIAERIEKETGNRDIHLRTIEGFPKEVITDMARKWDADVIVMGSHGRGALGRLFLGSVSSAVSTNAPCSVILVRPSKQKTDSTIMVTPEVMALHGEKYN